MIRLGGEPHCLPFLTQPLIGSTAAAHFTGSPAYVGMTIILFPSDGWCLVPGLIDERIIKVTASHRAVTFHE